MRILSSAQACGFGPVSKLVAITPLLAGSRVDFVGQGVALDFARRHSHRFHRITEGDTSRHEDLAQGLADADLVVSVMDAELVFRAVRAGRPVLFFDSLLGFWLTDRSFEELAARAQLVRWADHDTARYVFDTLAPHERILLAHLLARRSYAQNFPGVPARIAALAATGADHIELCGPIVDRGALEGALTQPPPERPAGLLINLGGFQNFFLDYESHNAYLDLVRRWVSELAVARPELGRILVCGGAFRRGVTETHGDVEVEYAFLPQTEFLRQLAHAPLYAVPPSLTSLHESVILRRLPLLLPEQHYGHIANLRALRGTVAGDIAASLTDLGSRFIVPEDDLEGTKALDRLTRELLTDESGYRRLADHLDTRLTAYQELTQEERGAAVDELGALLGGPALAELLDLVDLTPATAGSTA
ncbi:hypothetical protein CP980_33440 [Streptomyces vinaceus]|uniref:Glycosyltransferase n=1 Tax=Streptomyces vinaceus TaxID=1960 RepID=A0A5J6JLF8_STRVI|nr:hypothetical protein [Streptomyces vinaceus]QEV49324.1 hypothetical protein CP980_33440 [Streptomyces vinaceus]GHE44443.1 hypothetical protein GCM10017778_29860 [Streptomyces vinaceus]